MSKYTDDEPFEFGEGRSLIMVWRDHLGGLKWFGGLTNDHVMAALVAFHEAERDEWRWTNDDHTEARKGRFVVTNVVSDHYQVSHDDFNGERWQTLGRPPYIPSPSRAQSVLDDFLAWKSAQEQPSEPTGLGAVVEAGGWKFVHSPDRFEGADTTPWHTRDDHTDGGGFYGWADILTRYPVTVLSEGVQS